MKYIAALAAGAAFLLGAADAYAAGNAQSGSITVKNCSFSRENQNTKKSEPLGTGYIDGKPEYAAFIVGKKPVARIQLAVPHVPATISDAQCTAGANKKSAFCALISPDKQSIFYYMVGFGSPTVYLANCK